MTPLQGRTALVTGGAHRVGKVLVLALAQAGADVIVHYGGSARAAEQTADEVRKLGRRASVVQADLADPVAIQGLVSEVAEWGGLDVLVNNAARFDRAPFDETTSDAWDQTMAVNLRAPFLLMQAALPLMRQAARQHGTASVLNIADLSGQRPWAKFAAHGTSKAGLLHLTRIAARELAPQVRVNALVLGPVLPTGDQDSPAWQRSIERLPLGTPTSTDDIGQAAVFLAAAQTVTGAVLNIDSGESAGLSTH